MTRCDCQNPCSCWVAPDGDSPTVTGTGNGRFNTDVNGVGTTSDPYLIGFIDSEFYLPPAGEVFSTTTKVAANNATLDSVNFDTIVFDTPTFFFVGFPFFNISLYVPENRFWFVHASCLFKDNGFNTGFRKLGIVFSPPYDQAAGATFLVAGKTVFMGTAPPTGNSDVYASCSGFVPQEIAGNNSNGFFYVVVYQNSGSPMNIQEARFSIVAV